MTKTRTSTVRTSGITLVVALGLGLAACGGGGGRSEPSGTTTVPSTTKNDLLHVFTGPNYDRFTLSKSEAACTAETVAPELSPEMINFLVNEDHPTRARATAAGLSKADGAEAGDAILHAMNDCGRPSSEALDPTDNDQTVDSADSASTTEATTTTEPEPVSPYSDQTVKVVKDGWTYTYQLLAGVHELGPDSATITKDITASPPGSAQVVIELREPNMFQESSPNIALGRVDSADPGRTPPELPVTAELFWVNDGDAMDLTDFEDGSYHGDAGLGYTEAGRCQTNAERGYDNVVETDGSYLSCRVGEATTIRTSDIPEANADALVAAVDAQGAPIIHVQFKSAFGINNCGVAYFPDGTVKYMSSDDCQVSGA
jgi:hypothetical protein